MENLKPFDQMTIVEIEQELKEVYTELLRESIDVDQRIAHEDATKDLIKLRGNFEAMRILGGLSPDEDDAKIETMSGGQGNA